MAPPLIPGDLITRVSRDVERSMLRARNGIRYVRGTHRPKLGVTPKDVVWRSGKAERSEDIDTKYQALTELAPDGVSVVPVDSSNAIAFRGDAAKEKAEAEAVVATRTDVHAGLVIGLVAAGEGIAIVPSTAVPSTATTAAGQGSDQRRGAESAARRAAGCDPPPPAARRTPPRGSQASRTPARSRSPRARTRASPTRAASCSRGRTPPVSGVYSYFTRSALTTRRTWPSILVLRTTASRATIRTS